MDGPLGSGDDERVRTQHERERQAVEITAALFGAAVLWGALFGLTVALDVDVPVPGVVIVVAFVLTVVVLLRAGRGR